jgi:hypothetical protein
MKAKYFKKPFFKTPALLLKEKKSRDEILFFLEVGLYAW